MDKFFPANADPITRSPDGCYPTSVRTEEESLIKNRRKSAKLDEDGPRVGLALSGGGIRSATFCLGVLQALAGRRLLRHVDFLSTVSGGGYAGSFLGRMFTRKWVSEKAPTKPEDLKEWPWGVDEAVKIQEEGYPSKRVEAILDDHRSAPMLWLRESGRYLAPTGGGDLLMAGAVSFRNWAAVFLVVITTLMAVFFLGTAIRASLWQWDGWEYRVEVPLIEATASHWWWSPALLLPAAVFLLSALPLGWSYWLTQKDRNNKLEIPQWLTVAAVLLIAAGCFHFPERLGQSEQTRIVGQGVAASVMTMSAMTLFYYVTAAGRSVLLSVLALAAVVGGVLVGQLPAAVPFRIVALAGFFYLCAGASRRNQQRFNVIRNRLSRWFSTAFFTTLLLLLVAVIDSLGQMAYALLRPENGPGFKGFLGVTGVLAIMGLAPRIKLLLDQLPDKKTAQMPVSLLAGVAAVVLSLALLISISALANGLAWGWDNPCSRNSLSPAVVPAVNLSKQLHGESRVELTEKNLVKVVDAKVEAPSELTDEMSSKWIWAAFIVCLILSFLFGRTLTFLNLSSHQALYSARITRAYHGASNEERWFGSGQRLGEALDTDDIVWRDYAPHASGGPLHIVNVTMNETVSGKSQVEYQDRQGITVAVGPAGLSVGAQFHALWGNFAQPAGGKPRSSAVDRIWPIHSGSSTTNAASAARNVAAADVSLHNAENAVAAEFGYHPLYGGKEDSNKRPAQDVERLTLRQWIGISGAAFTTGLGKGTSLGKSLLLGLANVRLGYWWDSQIEPGTRRRTAPEDYVKGNPIRDQLARIFPVQAHLLDEFLAQFRGPNSRLWYLSDGGHFDNTGAYELIRRRVPCIIVCDCGADPDYQFEDLGQLVRLVRIDFAAEVELLTAQEIKELNLGCSLSLFGDPKTFAKLRKGEEEVGESTDEADGDQKKGDDQKKGQDEEKNRKAQVKSPPHSGPHAILAWVWYPNEENESRKGGRSLMVILKPSLSGDETLDIAHYHSAYPDFPQETTLDQFFDEAQWESYRKLGRHVAEQVFRNGAEKS